MSRAVRDGRRVHPTGTVRRVREFCCPSTAEVTDMMRFLPVRLRRNSPSTPVPRRRGSVFVEYVLLVTLVGLGVIVGLATLRGALVNELIDLANAIDAITP
jgi:Flp pilus assembly pilin Flp